MSGLEHTMLNFKKNSKIQDSHSNHKPKETLYKRKEKSNPL